MDTNPDLPAKHNSPKYTQQMKFTVSWLAVLIVAYNMVVGQPAQIWTARLDAYLDGLGGTARRNAVRDGRADGRACRPAAAHGLPACPPLPQVLVHKCLGEANYYKGVTSPDGGGTNPCNPFTPQCDCSKLPDPVRPPKGGRSWPCLLPRLIWLATAPHAVDGLGCGPLSTS